jgi:hypothetical protein
MHGWVQLTGMAVAAVQSGVRGSGSRSGAAEDPVGGRLSSAACIGRIVVWHSWCHRVQCLSWQLWLTAGTCNIAVLPLLLPAV